MANDGSSAARANRPPAPLIDRDTAIARAEATIAALQEGVGDALGEDVAAARRAVASAAAQPGRAGHWLTLVFEHAHNVKGLAGTFGYDLATEVADALCAVLKPEPACTPVLLAHVRRHLEVLEIILRDGIAGDGGARRQELLARLG